MPFKVVPPLYNAWMSMKDRCRNPKFKQYSDYGGRGIKVCDRWLNSYKAFESDMGPKPTPKHTLDRIDNDGDYTPENCRWATRKEQQRNQRVTRWVTIDGKRYRAVDLAEIAGIKTNSIIERVERGLSYDEVVSPDVVTIGEASRIAAEKKKARTHCDNGHEFNEKNTYVDKMGWRFCRVCRNARLTARRKANGR